MLHENITYYGKIITSYQHNGYVEVNLRNMRDLLNSWEGITTKIPIKYFEDKSWCKLYGHEFILVIKNNEYILQEYKVPGIMPDFSYTMLQS